MNDNPQTTNEPTDGKGPYPGGLYHGQWCQKRRNELACPESKEQRISQMKALRRSGYTISGLASLFGISSSRVVQLLKGNT